MPRPVGERGAHRRRGARRRARGWPRRGRATSVNGRPWPASASRASSALDAVERRPGTRRPGRACSRRRSTARRGRAGGRRRSAAGARAGAGRRARARGRASRPPARRRGRSRPSTPGDEVAVGRRARRRCPLPTRAAARPSAAAAPPARRSGGRPRRGGRASASGSSSLACRCPCAGCSQTSQPGALADRRRLAAVVDVRVRADDEPHVLEPQPGLVERALEVGHRAGLVHPGVDEHDPVARGERPGVAVRDARPRQREPQAPDAREHALAAPHLALACRLAHRGGTLTCRRMGKRSRRRGAETLKAPESEYRSPEGDVLALRGRADARRRGSEYADGDEGLRRSRGRTPGSAASSCCSSCSRCAGRSPAPSRSSRRRSCSAATASRARTSAAGSATSLREHLAEHFPDVEAPVRWRPTPRASRRCCATTASTCSRASRSSCARRTLAAPLLLALQEELLRARGVAADPHGAARRRRGLLAARPRRPPRRLRRRRARRGAGDGRLDRHPGAGQHARAGARRRRRGWRAPPAPARPCARPRCARRWCLTLWPTAGRRAAGGHGHDGVRGLRPPRAVPRPRRRDRRLERAARASRRG